MKTNLYLFLLSAFVLFNVFQPSNAFETTPEKLNLEEEETGRNLPEKQELMEPMPSKQLEQKTHADAEGSPTSARESKMMGGDTTPLTARRFDENSQEYNTEIQPEELDMEFSFEE